MDRESSPIWPQRIEDMKDRTLSRDREAFAAQEIVPEPRVLRDERDVRLAYWAAPLMHEHVFWFAWDQRRARGDKRSGAERR